MSNVVIDVLREIFFPNRDRHAIPSLDGPWRPNHALDDAIDRATFDGPDDVVVHQGQVVVSSRAGVAGTDVNRPAGALASRGAVLAVAIDGEGVQLSNGTVLSKTDGAPLKYATGLAFVDDDTLIVTEGSQDEPTDRWVWDLMKKGRTGRVLRFDLKTGQGTTLVEGLQYPMGVAISGDRALVTEAWAHRLLSVGVKTGDLKVLIGNLPGYPARIRPASDGGWWVAFFAMRTQLVDFVLEEDDYRNDMIATVEPRWWIAPSLAAEGHFLEPCQGGGIKQLGITKPWAPPRSYGLVVKLSAELDAVQSFHSRVGGRHHGITSVVEHEGKLLAVSKGHGTLLEVTP